MNEKIEIGEFLERAKQFPVIDVRSPKEFEQGHIPEAYNIPLFSNQERATVGTIYKQSGKEAAVFKGLEIVGPKLVDFAKKAKNIAKGQELLVHCWRGGMRSESMAWLFKTSGIKSTTLAGGYKAYRNHVKNSFSTKAKIVVLSGMTGSGKTDVLHELAKQGEQVLDLEGIAHHKGSAFGAIGEKPQPSNEHFENLLHAEWQNFDFDRVIWIEDESRAVGRVFVPTDLFEQMRTTQVIQINIPQNDRIKRLVKIYAHVDKQLLADAIEGIKKRLGGLSYKQCMDALETDDYEKITELTLIYYDKAYNHGLSKRNPKTIKQLFFEQDIPEQIAKEAVVLAKKIG